MATRKFETMFPVPRQKDFLVMRVGNDAPAVQLAEFQKAFPIYLPIFDGNGTKVYVQIWDDLAKDFDIDDGIIKERYSLSECHIPKEKIQTLVSMSFQVASPYVGMYDIGNMYSKTGAEFQTITNRARMMKILAITLGIELETPIAKELVPFPLWSYRTSPQQ